MINKQALFYAVKLYNNEYGLSNIPLLYQQLTDPIITKIKNNDEELLDTLKNIITQKLNLLFVEKRDAIRWIDEYGFDCASEDITNFLAAFLILEMEYNTWKTSGEDGEQPSTYYKVYVDKINLSKNVVKLNYDTMLKVYSLVRSSQFEAYSWLQEQKSKLTSLTTYADIVQYAKDNNITILD